MKKRIMIFILLLALLAALSGCGGETAAPQNAGLPAEETEQVILPVEEAEEQELPAEEPEAPAEAEEAEEAAPEEPEEEQILGIDEDIELPDEEQEEEPAPAEPAEEPAPEEPQEPEGPAVAEDGEYSSPEDVALYLHTFGRLPGNFITKDEATDLGWVSSRGNLWDVAPGMSIGGDRFGNYEGLLPKGNYRECDVNYYGGFRGGERLIYGTDGSIWYTNDHYESFTQLY